ncbi:MAG: lysophospholipase [Betaproteobacteria bacterium]|nr:lysophospholipase [Betaproteobacteria bacterium]MDH5220334.1 lysophospholipase [Betaproteobacteria bacterium]MDH5349777.1 lysophospholipase [Betaproteobacteria bacterium]
MPQTLSLPGKNSTTVRFMFETLTRRLALRTSSLLAPGLAGLWAERLFLTPPQPLYPSAEVFDLLDARQSYLQHRGRHIAMWHWGAKDAPAVLLAHGWGGRATQMRRFVAPLLAAGYRVIAYDQPAHGLSDGRLTGLPDFADVLDAVARHHGGVRAVITHSLGGPAAAVAMARGLRLERAVLVSPPSDLVGYSRRFARWFAIPERVRRRMQAAIEERFGVRWADLELARVAPHVDAEALVIHDRQDGVIPWRQGAAVARQWRGARLLSTQGLGHGRILQDEGVARAAADFIAGRAKVAVPAHPELPYPAPLY